MNKKYTLICAVVLALGLSAQGAHAGKPVKCTDVDLDGYGNPGVSTCTNGSATDCNDSNNTIYPGATEICGDGIDQDCNGSDLACNNCVDTDGDGFGSPGSASCSGGSATDCNNNNNTIFPGAPEVQCDGIDQDCSGADACTSNPHAALTYQDYPSNCLNCHDGGIGGSQYVDMFNSLHYKWMGDAPDMTNAPAIQQGKLTNELNSYCINILGDWKVCGTCHAGRGMKPGTGDTKANIDCLVCHSSEYATQRVRLADGVSMGVVTPTDTMVRNITKPTRTTCLQCHAKAGGGDGVKRGTLSLATITNASPTFDVHMNTTGPDLSCQACHTFVNHKVTGKGSDLRPTDLASEVKCTTCHATMDSGSGHTAAGGGAELDRHVARVACQSCHIPTYAKVATETHRDFQFHHDGSPADGVSGPSHPLMIMQANLIPEYRFWNRTSENQLLGDNANLQFDAVKGTYNTSRPNGNVNDGKLYPFKYKTAHVPIARGGSCDGQLIALNTLEFLKISGNVDLAISQGLAAMGCSGDTVEWVNSDTYQLLNHGVNPSVNATACTQCHGSLTTNLNLASDSMLDKQGYKLKDTGAKICAQCHREKSPRGQTSMHNHLAKGSGIDCLFCHTFTRPERGLCSPCNPNCVNEFVDNVAYPHDCN
jgi:hypothetical protein